MSNPYNWKKSKQAFDTFAYVCLYGKTSLTILAKDFNIEKSSASRRINCFHEAGLINSHYENREMFFEANEKQIEKITGLTFIQLKDNLQIGRPLLKTRVYPKINRLSEIIKTEIKERV